MDRIDAYLVLNLLPDIGPIRVRRLLDQFGSPESILAASRGELAAVDGIGKGMADRLVDWENIVDVPEDARVMESETSRADDPEGNAVAGWCRRQGI